MSVDGNAFCRLCRRVEENLIGIFEERLERIDICEKMQRIIHVTTGVKIDRSDTICQTVCKRCYELCVKAFKFRETCLNNDRAIKCEEKRLHPTVTNLVNLYPRIKLPVQCLQYHVDPVVSLPLDEVENYFKRRNLDITKYAKIALKAAHRSKTTSKSKNISDKEKTYIGQTEVAETYTSSDPSDGKCQSPIRPINIRLDSERSEFKIVRKDTDRKSGSKDKYAASGTKITDDIGPSTSLSTSSRVSDKAIVNSDEFNNPAKKRKVHEGDYHINKDNEKSVLLKDISKTIHNVQSDKSHLEKHASFVCSMCSSVQRSAKSLKRHEHRHFRCQYCKSKFKTIETKERHIESSCLMKNAVNIPADGAMDNIVPRSANSNDSINAVQRSTKISNVDSHTQLRVKSSTFECGTDVLDPSAKNAEVVPVEQSNFNNSINKPFEGSSEKSIKNSSVKLGVKKSTFGSKIDASESSSKNLNNKPVKQSNAKDFSKSSVQRSGNNPKSTVRSVCHSSKLNVNAKPVVQATKKMSPCVPILQSSKNVNVSVKQSGGTSTIIKPFRPSSSERSNVQHLPMKPVSAQGLTDQISFMANLGVGKNVHSIKNTPLEVKDLRLNITQNTSYKPNEQSNLRNSAMDSVNMLNAEHLEPATKYSSIRPLSESASKNSTVGPKKNPSAKNVFQNSIDTLNKESTMEKLFDNLIYQSTNILSISKPIERIANDSTAKPDKLTSVNSIVKHVKQTTSGNSNVKSIKVSIANTSVIPILPSNANKPSVKPFWQSFAKKYKTDTPFQLLNDVKPVAQSNHQNSTTKSIEQSMANISTVSSFSNSIDEPPAVSTAKKSTVELVENLIVNNSKIEPSQQASPKNSTVTSVVQSCNGKSTVKSIKQSIADICPTNSFPHNLPNKTTNPSILSTPEDATVKLIEEPNGKTVIAKPILESSIKISNAESSEKLCAENLTNVSFPLSSQNLNGNSIEQPSAESLTGEPISKSSTENSSLFWHSCAAEHSRAKNLTTIPFLESPKDLTTVVRSEEPIVQTIEDSIEEICTLENISKNSTVEPVLESAAQNTTGKPFLSVSTGNGNVKLVAQSNATNSTNDKVWPSPSKNSNVKHVEQICDKHSNDKNSRQSLSENSLIKPVVRSSLETSTMQQLGQSSRENTTDKTDISSINAIKSGDPSNAKNLTGTSPSQSSDNSSDKSDIQLGAENAIYEYFKLSENLNLQLTEKPSSEISTGEGGERVPLSTKNSIAKSFGQSNPRNSISRSSTFESRKSLFDAPSKNSNIKHVEQLSDKNSSDKTSLQSCSENSRVKPVVRSSLETSTMQQLGQSSLENTTDKPDISSINANKSGDQSNSKILIDTSPSQSSDNPSDKSDIQLSAENAIYEYFKPSSENLNLQLTEQPSREISTFESGERVPLSTKNSIAKSVKQSNPRNSISRCSTFESGKSVSDSPSKNSNVKRLEQINDKNSSDKTSWQSCSDNSRVKPVVRLSLETSTVQQLGQSSRENTTDKPDISSINANKSGDQSIAKNITGTSAAQSSDNPNDKSDKQLIAENAIYEYFKLSSENLNLQLTQQPSSEISTGESGERVPLSTKNSSSTFESEKPVSGSPSKNSNVKHVEQISDKNSSDKTSWQSCFKNSCVKPVVMPILETSTVQQLGQSSREKTTDKPDISSINANKSRDQSNAKNLTDTSPSQSSDNPSDKSDKQLSAENAIYDYFKPSSENLNLQFTEQPSSEISTDESRERVPLSTKNSIAKSVEQSNPRNSISRSSTFESGKSVSDSPSKNSNVKHVEQITDENSSNKTSLQSRSANSRVKLVVRTSLKTSTVQQLGQSSRENTTDKPDIPSINACKFGDQSNAKNLTGTSPSQSSDTPSDKSDMQLSAESVIYEYFKLSPENLNPLLTEQPSSEISTGEGGERVPLSTKNSIAKSVEQSKPYNSISRSSTFKSGKTVSDSPKNSNDNAIEQSNSNDPIKKSLQRYSKNSSVNSDIQSSVKTSTFESGEYILESSKKANVQLVEQPSSNNSINKSERSSENSTANSNVPLGVKNSTLRSEKGVLKSSFKNSNITLVEQSNTKNFTKAPVRRSVDNPNLPINSFCDTKINVNAKPVMQASEKDFTGEPILQSSKNTKTTIKQSVIASEIIKPFKLSSFEKSSIQPRPMKPASTEHSTDKPDSHVSTNTNPELGLQFSGEKSTSESSKSPVSKNVTPLEELSVNDSSVHTSSKNSIGKCLKVSDTSDSAIKVVEESMTKHPSVEESPARSSTVNPVRHSSTENLTVKSAGLLTSKIATVNPINISPNNTTIKPVEGIHCRCPEKNDMVQPTPIRGTRVDAVAKSPAKNSAGWQSSTKDLGVIDIIDLTFETADENPIKASPSDNATFKSVQDRNRTLQANVKMVQPTQKPKVSSVDQSTATVSTVKHIWQSSTKDATIVDLTSETANNATVQPVENIPSTSQEKFNMVDPILSDSLRTVPMSQDTFLKSGSILKPSVNIRNGRIPEQVESGKSNIQMVISLLKQHNRIDQNVGTDGPDNSSICVDEDAFEIRLKNFKRQLHLYKIPITMKEGPLAASYVYRPAFKESKSKKLCLWDNLIPIDISPTAQVTCSERTLSSESPTINTNLPQIAIVGKTDNQMMLSSKQMVECSIDDNAVVPEIPVESETENALAISNVVGGNVAVNDSNDQVIARNKTTEDSSDDRIITTHKATVISSEVVSSDNAVTGNGNDQVIGLDTAEGNKSNSRVSSPITLISQAHSSSPEQDAAVRDFLSSLANAFPVHDNNTPDATDANQTASLDTSSNLASHSAQTPDSNTIPTSVIPSNILGAALLGITGDINVQLSKVNEPLPGTLRVKNLSELI